MDGQTLIHIQRNNKDICFLLREGENLNLDNIVDVFVSDQPERSKREDFCLTTLADQFIEEWVPRPSEHVTLDEAYIKGAYDFSDWLKQKMRCSEHCGNTVRDK